MDTQAKAVFEKKPRVKSALYPAVSIYDCYEFIKLIDSLGGNNLVLSRPAVSLLI